MPDFSEEIRRAGFVATGTTLVEASAGTGKTYNIQNVYLRLVLEHDLAVERILVVTFTEAATHELRERLRRILGKARDLLEGNLADADADRERIETLVGIARSKKIPPEEQLSRLRLALMDFDNAAVFTIHGFCKRVLDRYAFECGHDPGSDLIADESRITESTCMDWWRRETYRKRHFRENVPFEDPRELRAFLRESLSRPDAILHPVLSDDSPGWKQLARALSRETDALRAALADPGPYERPNVAGKRLSERWLPELNGLLASTHPDKYAIRTHLESMKADVGGATWGRPVRGLPDPLREVVPAARAAWTGIGSLAGTIAWQGRHRLQRGSKATMDVSALASALDSHRGEVADWLAGPTVSLRKNKDARAFVAGLQALCRDDFDWPAKGDAKPFCSTLRDVARPELDRLFAPGKAGLDEMHPPLQGVLHGIRIRVLAEMAAVLESLGATVREKVRERGVLTYNDLLRNVRSALRDEHGGERLKNVLRSEFRAALIDEFQDTDPVQYRIFDLLFPPADLPLFFVGDPKQAIYGFRGGDVFTYYTAKATVPPARRQDLGTNYRSEQYLVDAVNELFRDRDGRTFVHDAIPYDGSLRANDVPDDRALQVGAARDPAPFKLWRYACDGDSVPGMNSESARQMYADVAEETVRLLQDADTRIGGRPIRASDIAVLVCTHNEANAIYLELKERGVNAVRQSTGNVFDTAEAREMAVIMQAMLEPGDAYAVRGALATSLLPCSIEELYRFCTTEEPPPIREPDSIPRSIEGWMEAIRTAGDRWRRRSFIEAFRFLVDRLDLRTHIVGLADGERRLTNTLHLAELAHQAANESQQGPVGLLNWFSLQLSGDTRDEKEEYEIRLASDEDAVSIMTVFKSKGLEFPIVFVPTMWRKEARSRHPTSSMLTYHDEANRVVMDLDVDNPEAAAAARSEALQENLRLVYVAVTRAVHRVYLFAIGAGEPDRYALERLLAAWDARPDADATSRIDAVTPAAGTGPEEKRLARAFLDPDELQPRSSRTGPPRVDKRHGHTSFSGLEPGTRETAEFVLRDVDVADDRAGPAEAGDRLIGEDIFAIPGGAKTGDCWHRIFELLDFQGDEETRAQIVDQELDRFGICTGPTQSVTNARRTAVQEMVRRVLETPLTDTDGEPPVRLRDIPLSARASEMSFYFSLKQQGDAQRTDVIRHVLERNWRGRPERDTFLAALGSWDRELPLGFMTGVIDLVCCHTGRFYILDWKSNRRAGRIEDFGPSGLLDEMARHAYFLQYLLYTVAIDAFLAKELQRYDYEKHFGGVFYVFLRGVTGEPGRGVFADRPSHALVRELAEVLATGKGGAA